MDNSVRCPLATLDLLSGKSGKLNLVSVGRLKGGMWRACRSAFRLPRRALSPPSKRRLLNFLDRLDWSGWPGNISRLTCAVV